MLAIGWVLGRVRSEAAVDTERLARHERGVVGREERDGAGDLLGIAEPPDQVTRAVAPEAITHRAAQRGLRLAVDDDTRCDGVAANTAFAVGSRHVSRQRDESGLRSPVRGQRMAAVE